jgi:methylated-DNA-[protein]-cysteine S-methyltransferase
MTTPETTATPGNTTPPDPVPQPLDALPPPDDATVARLHHRLAAAAADTDLLDVAYRTLDTPVGSLLLAATDAGLVRVAYEAEDHDVVLAELAARISPRILRAPARLDPVAQEIDEYFAGRRQRFAVPLDLQLSLGFRRSVLGQLQQIAYGATASYAAVAAAAGNPKAVRAVGSACANNPLPVVVPCHRVVRSDGSIGQYLGGTAAKRTLLDLESAAPTAA